MSLLCKKCGNEFDGKYCKPCDNLRTAAYYAKNKEKVKARINLYSTKNPEKKKERSRKWYADNKEHVKIVGAKYRALNPEKIKAKNAKWLAENPEARRIISQRYNQANLEKNRIIAHNKRAKKRNNGGKLSKGLAEKLFKLQRGKCACCSKPLGNDYHLDHIMPIALGGANEDWNIQLLRQRCNNQKWIKHPVEFMQSRGFLL